MESNQEKYNYLKSLRANHERLQKRNDKLSGLICLFPVLYFLIRESYISNVDFGFFQLNQLKIGLVAIPPLFAATMFYYLINSTHTSKIYKECQKTAFEIYHGRKAENDKEMDSSEKLSLLLPFSIWNGFVRGYKKGSIMGWIILILILPLFSIIVLPFWFIYFTSKIIFCELWDIGFIAKFSLVSTIWIAIAVLVFFIAGIEKELSDKKSK